MQIKDIASAIAKIEGHKSQTRIGDIREILAIVADMSVINSDVIATIMKLGVSRAKRRKKNG